MTSFEKSQWSKGCFAQEYRDNADIYVIERARMLNILKFLYRHFMKNKRKKNILDLGCGDGIVSHELLKTEGPVSATLLDGSSGMLEAAKVRLKDFKNVIYVQAGFQELLRKEVLHKNYDFIASSLAIHHLTMKEKKALFQENISAPLPRRIFCEYRLCPCPVRDVGAAVYVHVERMD